MDDIAFFDSSSSSRRGGIYADTSRNENPPSSFPESPTPTEDDRTPASEPIIEAAPAVTSNSPEPKPPLQRSHSAEEAESSKSEPTPALARPATVSATGISSTNSSSSSSANIRKPWFTAVKESGNDDPFGDVYDDGYSRGRPTGVDPIRRSPSPHPPNGVTTTETEEDQHNRHLNALPVRSALSHRSQSSSSQGATEPSSVDDTSSSAPSDSLLSAFRSRSPSISLTRKDSGVSTTSSNFFQTLKTRDKQAISNTAKEAMRKWGVNWGGLKKDNVPTVNTSDQDTSADHRRALGPDSQPASGQKPRPSYAEVRAAVEQRREKERAEAEGLGVSDSQTTLHAGHSRSRSTSSSALPIEQQRSASPAYLGGANLSPSTSPRPPAPTEDERLDVSSRPPSPRIRTLSHRSTGPSESGNLPTEVEHPSDMPLHTRPPQPKMMTIPGIHASHRGEVMSMGYAPPPPVPNEPKKAPAIQSITRLWNKSAPSGQPQVQTGFTGNDQDANTTPPMSSGSPPRPEIPTPSGSSKIPGSPPLLPSRPIPPPLPPRSNTTHAVQTKPDSPRTGETDQGTSPASAALQSIVSKDRSKRESLGNLTSISTPPSPSRREDPATDHGVSAQGPPSGNLDSDSTVPSITDTTFAPSVEASANVSPQPPALPPRRIQASA